MSTLKDFKKETSIDFSLDPNGNEICHDFVSNVCVKVCVHSWTHRVLISSHKELIIANRKSIFSQKVLKYLGAYSYDYIRRLQKGE